MVAATLCGITDPRQVKRSVCAMGHKWMWNPKWDGLPPQAFLSKVDPLFDGVREKLAGEYLHLRSHRRASLARNGPRHWACARGFRFPWVHSTRTGMRSAPAAAKATSSTWSAHPRASSRWSKRTTLVPGVCGVVPGSVHPAYTGVEAGLSATGDIFEAIARRAGTKVTELSQGLEHYRAGQTGLLRLSWDNGDRTVLVNAELGGVTLGWNLMHTAQDELFAAIEGTAFHTRIILERMAENGVPVERVINGGGIPQQNAVLNQVYANVLNKPVLVPDGTPTSLGSCIFALLAAGAISPSNRGRRCCVCRTAHFCRSRRRLPSMNVSTRTIARSTSRWALQDAAPAALGAVLPELKRIAAEVASSLLDHPELQLWRF